MPKHILVPTDGSRLSKKVVKEAIALAKALRAKVTGVHAFPANFGIAIDARTQDQLRKQAQADGTRYLDDMEAAARSARIRFDRLLLKNDDPWRAIIGAARKQRCDLIMMAAHGRRGLAAIVLGSETNKVLVHSKIPVLVYR